MNTFKNCLRSTRPIEIQKQCLGSIKEGLNKVFRDLREDPLEILYSKLSKNLGLRSYKFTGLKVIRAFNRVLLCISSLTVHHRSFGCQLLTHE